MDLRRSVDELVALAVAISGTRSSSDDMDACRSRSPGSHRVPASPGKRSESVAHDVSRASGICPLAIRTSRFDVLLIARQIAPFPERGQAGRVEAGMMSGDP